MSAKKNRPTKAAESTQGAAHSKKPKTVTQRAVLDAPAPDVCPQGGPHEWDDDDCTKCHEPKPQSAVRVVKAKGKTAGHKPKTAAQAKPMRAKSAPKAKKLSALDAAAQVLAEAQEPMTTRQMIESMAAKGYWSSPNGATPAATLYSAILRQINTQGKDARFKKTDRGQFALNR